MTQRALTDFVARCFEEWKERWPESQRAARPGIAFFIAQRLIEDRIVEGQ